MALDYLIEDIGTIASSYRELYEQTENGYRLKVNGVDDFEKKLSNKSKEILTEKKQLQEKLKDYQTQLETINEEKAKKAGDYESLIKSAEQKRVETENKYKQIINKYNTEKKSNYVKDISMQLCDGVNAKLISPHIASRLSVNESGDVVVLDVNGNPTVNTVDDLINEIKGNDDYALLLRGTKASGGNAVGASGTSINRDVSKMSARDKIAYFYQHQKK